MVRLIFTASLLASTLASPFPSILEARSRLMKRDIAADVCGSSESTRPATDNLNADTWNLYNMGEWFKNYTQPYTVLNWAYTWEGEKIPDIQSVVLKDAGEGLAKCLEVQQGSSCSGDGFDRQQCLDNPELHFVWDAITHFSGFLESLYTGFHTSTTSVGFQTGDMVQNFYTPQSEPSNLIMPVSVVAGIAGVLGGAWPAFALPAGAGAIINGALTQAGLDKADPLKQWTQVQDAVGQLFTQAEKALEAYYDWAFLTTPSDALGYYYEDDPAALPSVLASGQFAGAVKVPIFPPGIYSTLASSAINALWVQDKVLIIKISDATYGKGPGSACKAFPDITYCDENGVAHIFVRWQFSNSEEIGSVHFEPRRWQVWGAYPVGDDNDDHLKEFDLNLEIIAKSADKNQARDGFLSENMNGQVMDALQNNPDDLSIANLAQWNLPVCDLDAILGGKVLQGPPDETGDDPIVEWGACSCLLAEGWPADDDKYPDPKNSYQADTCKSQGWGDSAPS